MQGCCLGFLLYLEAGLRNTLISMLSWETIHGFYTSIILSKKNKIPSSSFTFFSSTLFSTGHYLTFFLLAHFWGITLQFWATWWRISIFLTMRQKVRMRLKFLVHSSSTTDSPNWNLKMCHCFHAGVFWLDQFCIHHSKCHQTNFRHVQYIIFSHINTD